MEQLTRVCAKLIAYTTIVIPVWIGERLERAGRRLLDSAASRVMLLPETPTIEPEDASRRFRLDELEDYAWMSDVDFGDGNSETFGVDGDYRYDDRIDASDLCGRQDLPIVGWHDHYIPVDADNNPIYPEHRPIPPEDGSVDPTWTYPSLDEVT